MNDVPEFLSALLERSSRIPVDDFSTPPEIPSECIEESLGTMDALHHGLFTIWRRLCKEADFKRVNMSYCDNQEEQKRLRAELDEIESSANLCGALFWGMLKYSFGVFGRQIGLNGCEVVVLKESPSHRFIVAPPPPSLFVDDDE